MNASRRVTHRTLVVCLSCLMTTPALARDFYVDQDNVAANDANAGSIDRPWKTITKANNTLIAGDTVYIRAGTYNNVAIVPTRSGTASARITYRNYGAEVVTIANAVNNEYGLLLDGKSYVTVQGINFTGQKRFLYIRGGAHHDIIAYCSFDDAKLTAGATATWAGSSVAGNAQHNWIHHCRFSNYGYYNSDDKGAVLDIGHEMTSTDLTRYNLFEDNDFFHGGHHVIGVYGKYNVIRDNYFHNEPWSMGTADSDRGAVLYGDRNLSFSGYSTNGGRNLIEGNRVGYASDPPDNVGASGMSANSSENIIRRNMFFNNINAGLSMTVTENYLQSVVRNKVYNNTLFNNGHNPQEPTGPMAAGIGFAVYNGPLLVEDNVFKNNLLYRHRVPFGEYNINTSDRKGLLAVQTFANNWNGETQGDPKFVDADPTFNDPTSSTLPDFHLQPDSPCKDSGTFLTTITSTSGSGTAFVVADAGYFMDGWGIDGVQGDEIQLFGTAQRAQVTAVDYATNSITVDRTVSWTQDQGIGLTYEGAAPDVGAFEIGAGNATTPAPPQALRVAP